MNLLIDIGNTRTKAALVENGRVIETKILATEADWIGLVKKNLQNILVSSVRSDTAALLTPLLKEGFEPKFLTANTRLPVKVDYKTPETLGTDRIAAAIGAMVLAGNKPSLAVMAGTCITCDLCVQEVYLGGSIAPGVEMRLKAMHSFTDKLPLVEISQAETSFPGKSTHESLWLGAVEGARLEIFGRISSLRKEYPDLIVFVAGGDAAIFESSVNPPIFVNPDLLFVGLNRILEYNV